MIDLSNSATMILMGSIVLMTASLSNAFVTQGPLRTTPSFLGRGTRLGQQDQAFVARRRVGWLGMSSAMGGDGGGGTEDNPDNEGENLAAEFFKMAQQKGIGLEREDLIDLDDEEDGEDDEEEDDEEVNIPQGAINAFLGYDRGDVGDKLAGNVSLTNDQLYSEVKERVLDTAGGFVELVGGPRDDEDDDAWNEPKKYEPPKTVPDSELTAGEVVLTVLESLNHNDVPSTNFGVQVLFGYSSPGSQITNEEGLTPDEYADFLKETEYKILFDHQEVVIDKGDYSFDGKKAYFTARLRVGPGPLDFTSVNFILSTASRASDDSCWLVDSMLIRPESMRRRRRK